MITFPHVERVNFEGCTSHTGEFPWASHAYVHETETKWKVTVYGKEVEARSTPNNYCVYIRKHLAENPAKAAFYAVNMKCMEKVEMTHTALCIIREFELSGMHMVLRKHIGDHFRELFGCDLSIYTNRDAQKLARNFLEVWNSFDGATQAKWQYAEGFIDECSKSKEG